MTKMEHWSSTTGSAQYPIFPAAVSIKSATIQMWSLWHLRPFKRWRCKIIFVLSYILYTACLYVFELFSIKKYILLLNCLQVVHCPLVPISCDNEYYRPQFAAAAFCTIGDRAHCKAALSLLTSSNDDTSCFWKTMFCRHIYDCQCSVFWLMLWRMICIKSDKIVWTSENAWELDLFRPAQGTCDTSSTIWCSYLHWFTTR